MVTTYRLLGVVEDFSYIVFCHHLSHNVRRDVLKGHLYLERKRERAHSLSQWYIRERKRGTEKETLFLQEAMTIPKIIMMIITATSRPANWRHSSQYPSVCLPAFLSMCLRLCVCLSACLSVCPTTLSSAVFSVLAAVPPRMETISIPKENTHSPTQSQWPTALGSWGQ